MSDTVEDLVKQYNENVYKAEHPRSIGLFTIPEYPELESQRGMWSAALDAILTTLRYLAPATLLTIFWGQQSFLFKLLKHIDSAFRAIVFSSEEQKQAVLQWLAEAGPVRVEHLDTVWRHGWILCRVLDTALPGSCAGHPPTRLSLKHAQAIAEHYLGVEPVFTRNELESNDSLSRHQEWKLATYLERIREALSKLTPPVSKPVSQITSPETTQFILDYVAKGCGLSAIQINNKAHFKIYPTAQQSLDPGEVTILIRGPRDTYGMVVIPPILGKAQMIRHKILGLQSKQTYTEAVLPVTQGATYLRNYGKNDMNKTYYIPKTQYDIDIDVESHPEHVKISYMVKLEGKYIISVTSRGQNIAGSPFNVVATNNIISILEKDNYRLEDGEEIDIVDIQTDRRVVLRIVDFITEKMLLKENGTLEKISDEEAKVLMAINKEHKEPNINNEAYIETENNLNIKLERSENFKKAVHKILSMYRICKIFNKLYIERELKLQNEIKDSCIHPRNQQDVPDIVNSTFTEININPYIVSEMREKFIVPECISVSLRAEISKTIQDDLLNNTTSKTIVNNPVESLGQHTPDSLEIQIFSSEDEEDNISIDRTTAPIGNNPFLNEMFEENYAAANNFGTFVASEYETNNSQNEETKNSSIKIIINPDVTSSSASSLTTSIVNKNPFIVADVTDYERPKTPVFKIISGEKVSRDESVFVDPKSELIPEEELGNEFVNPFFMHQFQSSHFEQMPMADFIIGAPVSLPPIIRASSPDPEMKSLMTSTVKTERQKAYDTRGKYIDVVADSVYSTPLHNNISIQKENRGENLSLESNLTENVDNSNASTTSDSQFESEQNYSNRDVTSRKDMWDSAYVSIDDNNSSPDSNNNDNSNLSEKKNLTSSEERSGLKLEEMSNMGPAEREIWQTCSELNNNTHKLHEDIKAFKWEIKRPIFTPIIEESDRSISSTKDNISIPGIYTKQVETDTVSVAFAELNDMYLEYFPNSETISASIPQKNKKGYCMAVKDTQIKDKSVNSASEESDVKRHENDLEGTISEVQASVTESVSVSQTLHNEQNNSNDNNRIETQFGQNSYSNIVLEKKKYWDDRIREIEAKAQEVIVPKKRRISAKQLKHDSLSKRRGKQMIKNFLNAGDYSQVTNINQIDDKEQCKNQPTQSMPKRDSLIESVRPDEKLVSKWKRYWDDKLEMDQLQTENKHVRAITPKCKSVIPSTDLNRQENIVMDRQENAYKIKYNVINTEEKNCTSNHNTPVKQELPEEIFKAFETSPKRFFGTSRKQILNKLDTFLNKPVDVQTSTTDVTMSCHESGLVSSRISLFHNMSNTEELAWARRKTQSMHDIYHRRESDKSVASVKITSNSEEIKHKPEVPKESVHIIERSKFNIAETCNLKKDRSIISPDSLDEILNVVCVPKALPEKRECIKIIQEQNKHIENTSKHNNDEFLSSRPKVEALRKKSFSKSEMDIFNKTLNEPIDDLDKYKSCDELPKINVKSFISLYESVSKTNDKTKPAKQVYRTSSTDSQKIYSNSITLDAVPKRSFTEKQTSSSNCESKCTTPGITPTNLWTSSTSQTISNMSLDTRTSDSYDGELIPNDKKETMYLSLSDIELEIIENSPCKSHLSSPEREVKPEHIEYKNRFKLAKEFFQSLDELRPIKRPRQLNECELLLRKQSIESLQDEQKQERPQKRVKKNIKSHSLPSTEIAKGWNKLQEPQERCSSEESTNTKLVKISEKFNVDDLFSDVTEGKLSRQGSLRGIPHKKAVLEAFRSMENVADTTISSYEISDSQLTDFSKEHRVTNAQTYLSEYPYLPKTDPSKSHSRIDVKASGLISLKELKGEKLRRNSVPDLRLNPNFTVDL